ncbi:MAG: dTDP-4-dehydrorhamnose reductase [Acidobacteriota bacterium]
MGRVAIFGSQGQLGVELAATFSARSYDVTCFGRKDVDITDAAAVSRAIADCDPKLVLNPAAFNQVDLAEQDPVTAFQVNALAVRNIALACRERGAQLVHYSTDYVFDGTAGRSYREEDPTHPIGSYAVSKLAGELYAHAYVDGALVIRTSAVFGPAGIHTARRNFVEMMLRLAAGGKPIRVVDSVASPTYAPALADRTADLLERGATGIFHIGGGTPISWHDWAAKIFQAAGLQPELQKTTQQAFAAAARRPQYSALSNAKMESLGIAPMPSLDEALRDYFARR